MFTTSRLKVLPVKNPVILVGDQLIDDLLIFCLRHEHEVLQGVPQITPIVHVNMSGSVDPSTSREIHHGFHRERRGYTRARPNLKRLLSRPVLESLDGFQSHLAPRDFECKLTG